MSTPASSTFRFRLGGIAFDGQFDGGLMTVAADLGPLPFSAEDGEARRRWHAALGSADTAAPDHHALDANRHIRFESATRIDGTVDRQRLLTALTVVMLGLRNRLGAPPQVAKRRFRAEAAPARPA